MRRFVSAAALALLWVPAACGGDDAGGGGRTDAGTGGSTGGSAGSSGGSSGATSGGSGGTTGGTGGASGGSAGSGATGGGQAGSAGSGGTAGGGGTAGSGPMALPYGFGNCPATKPAVGSACDGQMHCCWGFDDEKPLTCTGGGNPDAGASGKWVENNNGVCCPTSEPQVGQTCNTLGSLGACCYSGTGYNCSAQTNPDQWISSSCN